MNAIILSDENQAEVNQLRISLAQATIDMAEVDTQDLNSHQYKERVIAGLRKISRGLDQLGVVHSSRRRHLNG